MNTVSVPSELPNKGDKIFFPKINITAIADRHEGRFLICKTKDKVFYTECYKGQVKVLKVIG